jgi:UDP-N-acetylglucosamine--N-acetylmuramyl-(pentapeptide) pyrophosphoryl-undecaprenol N-acetylglucosamine transferase
VRVVIAGGGTGGHLFPGIAVAEEFKKRNKKAEVMFIGTEQGIEARVIPKEGYPIRFLKAEGVLGKSPLRKLMALWRLSGSVCSSWKILREVKPDVVIGTGGYVSVAPVACARLMSVPTLIMEQNLIPGLANRMLGKLVDAVAVTYYESISFFPRARTYLTGNPVRAGIMNGKKEDALKLFSLDEDKMTVMVSGGSSGARSINSVMVNALNYMLDVKDTVQFLHQTGEKDYESVRKVYRQLGFKAMVAPFIYQMAEAYAVADLVVSRAGATTIAELTALGKPSILIPYPHAAGHQEFNARKLFEIGACRMIPEDELSAEVLAENIKELCNSEEKLVEMRRQSIALGRADAAQKVVDIAMSLVRSKKGNV